MNRRNAYTERAWAPGLSTCGWSRWVETLGITRLSKSQVSQMAMFLDEQMMAFRTRPLDAGPYTFVAADARVLTVPRGRTAMHGGPGEKATSP